VLPIEYVVEHSPSLTSRFLVTKVPTKPPPNVEEVRNQFDQTLIRQLEEVGVDTSVVCQTSKRFLPTPQALPNAAGVDSCRPAQSIYGGPSTRNPQVCANALSSCSTTPLRTVVTSSKVFLPLTCYVFGDGPWRDTMVRFGYDPRQDPKARWSACIALTFRCIDQEIKLSKAIFPQSQPSHWSRLGSITTAGKSHGCCFHEPFVDRTSS
jgi:hypothetical protein